jgi:hypothetical protein
MPFSLSPTLSSSVLPDAVVREGGLHGPAGAMTRCGLMNCDVTLVDWAVRILKPSQGTAVIQAIRERYHSHAATS